MPTKTYLLNGKFVTVLRDNVLDYGKDSLHLITQVMERLGKMDVQ